MSALGDLLHKIVDVAAGVGNRSDLHDEIDGLDHEDSAEAAPDSAPEDVPAEETAPVPESAPPAPEAAPAVDDPVQVQEPVQVHVQEEGSSGEADA